MAAASDDGRKVFQLSYSDCTVISIATQQTLKNCTLRQVTVRIVNPSPHTIDSAVVFEVRL